MNVAIVFQIMRTSEQPQHHTNLDEVIANAKETLLRDGKHVTTLIVEGSKSLITGVIPDMPAQSGNRREYMSFIGQLAAKSGRIGKLRQIFLVSEGSVRPVGSGEEIEALQSSGSSRKEVLIIGSIHFEENLKFLKMFEILRDSEKQVIGFSTSLTDMIKDVSFDTPLEDAFVDGFRSESKIQPN